MQHESWTDAPPRPPAAGPRSRLEPDRFAALFTRHGPELKRYAIRRLGVEPADDIVAETFAQALQHLDSYDLARGDERSWLYGIATNLIGQHRRREVALYRALSRTGADSVMEPFTDEVEQRVVADAARRRLAGALAGLSRKHRDTLTPRRGPRTRGRRWRSSRRCLLTLTPCSSTSAPWIGS